jgi:predicted small lipoprotein YifL
MNESCMKNSFWINTSLTGRSMRIVIAIAALLALTGCGSAAFNGLNPFDSGAPEQDLGQRNLNAVLGGDGGGAQGGQSKEAENARHALEVMTSYRQAQSPQPAYPVVQPPEVRLMWVPDHRTKSGDFVPAHYYYLKVLDGDWAVQDAFDMEERLNATSKGQFSTSVPWVYGDPGKRR